MPNYNYGPDNYVKQRGWRDFREAERLEPYIQCALCNRRVERMEFFRDDMRALTVVRFSCHGRCEELAIDDMNYKMRGSTVLDGMRAFQADADKLNGVDRMGDSQKTKNKPVVQLKTKRAISLND